MNLPVLKAELTDDPESRGYTGMNDAEAAADLNTVYRDRDRKTMTGTEVLNAVDTSEWLALTDAKRQTVWDIVHLGTVNPFGVEATLLIQVFTSESQTITNLASARREAISRGVELGLGTIAPGHIENARM